MSKAGATWSVYPNQKQSRLSSRDIAYQSALFTPKSRYGETIVEKNPMEIKTLELTLAKLEKDKRFREQEYFWKQRQFFIEKAFDENNEIRYAKLNDKIIQNLKRDSKSESAKSTDPGSQWSIEKENTFHQTKVSLTGRFFPVIPVPEEERCKSVNYAKISESHKRFWSTVRANQAALAFLELRKKIQIQKQKRNINTDSENDNKKNEYSSQKQNGLLPNNTISSKLLSGKLFPTKCKSANFKKRENTRKSQDLMNCILPRDEIVRTKISESSASEKDSLQTKSISSSPRDSDTDDDMDTELDTRTDSLVHDILDSPRFTETEKKQDERFALRRKNSDHLLLRLSTSLPSHMMLKSCDSLHCLSQTIGYGERNKKFLEREKTFNSKVAVQDERFRKLQKALSFVKS